MNNWHNGGNWEGLPVSHMTIIFDQLCAAFLERIDIVPNAYSGSPVDPALPWKTADGALHGGGPPPIEEFYGMHIEEFVRFNLPRLQQVIRRVLGNYFPNEGWWPQPPGGITREQGFLNFTDWPDGWLVPEYPTDVRPWIQLRQAIERARVYGTGARSHDTYVRCKFGGETLYSPNHPSLQGGWDYRAGQEEESGWLSRSFSWYNTSERSSVRRHTGYTATEFKRRFNLKTRNQVPIPPSHETVAWTIYIAAHGGVHTCPKVFELGTLRTAGVWEQTNHLSGYTDAAFKAPLDLHLLHKRAAAEDEEYGHEEEINVTVSADSFETFFDQEAPYTWETLPIFTEPLPLGDFFDFGFEILTEVPSSTPWEKPDKNYTDAHKASGRIWIWVGDQLTALLRIPAEELTYTTDGV